MAARIVPDVAAVSVAGAIAVARIVAYTTAVIQAGLKAVARIRTHLRGKALTGPLTDAGAFANLLIRSGGRRTARCEGNGRYCYQTKQSPDNEAPKERSSPPRKPPEAGSRWPPAD